MKRQKGRFQTKAQVTVFIIIGIVLLIIVIALLALSNSLEGNPIAREGEDATGLSTELEPIKNYIETCVEQVAKDGIFLLGKQSGYIYRSQGGKRYDQSPAGKGYQYINFPEDSDNMVIYRITSSIEDTANQCKTQAPEYPVTNPKYPYLDETPVNLDVKNYRKDNCFGKGKYTNKKIIAKDLKSYIESNVNIRCTLDSFPEFEIVGETATANVSILDGETTVLLDYPLSIKNTNSGTRSNLRYFTSRISFSMKRVLDLVDIIIEKDVDDPTYRLTRAIRNYDDFSISVINDVHGKDDIVVITSNSDDFKIDGTPFEFYFARKNRPPVLEYVHNFTHNFVFENYLFIDYEDVIGQELTAVDPDEDSTEITVYIWDNRQHILDESNPYEILHQDYAAGYIDFVIVASDGELEDYWKTQSSGAT